VSHLILAGRMLVGLHLCSRAPGLKGIDISFVQPPELDVQFSPLGISVTELPGILNMLKARGCSSGVSRVDVLERMCGCRPGFCSYLSG
jgi:hypothetical protein